MNKYALLVVSSTTYFMGLNTLLNGLDYYGHKDVDVYVLYGEQMLPYLEFAKDKFIYPLRFFPIQDYGDMESRSVIRGNPEVPYGIFDENSNACWCKYGFMLRYLRDKYDAICYLDADCMVLNNMMPLFDRAASEDVIICPGNPRADGQRIKMYRNAGTYKELHDLCRGHVVENFPVFYNPQLHSDVNQYVWDFRDKEMPNDPELFNEALCQLNKDDKIVYLDGDSWLADFPYQVLYNEQEYDGKFGISNYKNDRVNIWHSRFWRRDGNQSLIRYAGDNATAKSNAEHNVAVGEKAVRLFNEYKVTLNDIKELGGGMYSYYIREWI